MIKLVWLGLICCSAANAIICYFETIPNVYILGVVLICCVLVWLHRHCTKKWCKQKLEEDSKDGEVIYRDYDEVRSSPFLSSFLVALVLTAIFGVSLVILFLLQLKLSFTFAPYFAIILSCFIGSLTATISFAVALIREAEYA